VRVRRLTQRSGAGLAVFLTVIALAPEVCGNLIEDERTQDLVAPFIGFFESDDPELEPADDIVECLEAPRRRWPLPHIEKKHAAGLSVPEIPRARQDSLQQRSWPPLSWIGGHGTVPNEQNTQQSPGLGRSSVPQPLQS